MNRMTASQTHQEATAPAMLAGGLLQRKCDCGQHTIAGGECSSCSEEREGSLQRSALNRDSTNGRDGAVPPIVHDVLRSPGQPLDAATRAFFEPRFGHDFSGVRVHTDARAAESAQAVNALAYTVGRNIVFGNGIPASGTTAGRRLLAHELTHVVQQRGSTSSASPLTLSPTADPAEREADSMAERALAGSTPEPVSVLDSFKLRRKIKIDNPVKKIPKPKGKGLDKTNAETVEDYLTTLCPAVAVDKKSGKVEIPPDLCTPFHVGFGVYTTPAKIMGKPTGCGCLCDLTKSANDWLIQVDDKKWPVTTFTDPDAANGKKPGGTGGIVTTPSPNSTKLWGTATASGKTLDIDPWLVLGHELCGHGWLGDSGKHGPDETSPRGEGGHQAAVARENELRREHGIELRGTFKEPNCGESYWRKKSSPGAVNWSDFHAVCIQWRNDYNKTHKTIYAITDTIP
jgi:hypothetical protein